MNGRSKQVAGSLLFNITTSANLLEGSNKSRAASRNHHGTNSIITGDVLTITLLLTLDFTSSIESRRSDVDVLGEHVELLLLGIERRIYMQKPEVVKMNLFEGNIAQHYASRA